jgi:hypothetical protein
VNPAAGQSPGISPHQRTNNILTQPQGRDDEKGKGNICRCGFFGCLIDDGLGIAAQYQR